MIFASRFCAFDTETTGLKADARIIEIACVTFENDEVKEDWSTLVRPVGVNWQDPDVQQALSVNQIKPEQLEGKPTFQEIFHRLFVHFQSVPVWVAHNAEFDLRMLDQEFSLYKGVPFPIKPRDICLDTKLLSHKIHPSEKSHRLQDVAPRWGVVPDGAHRASSDAITCGRILSKMSKGHLPTDIGQVHEFQKSASASWRSQRRY